MKSPTKTVFVFLIIILFNGDSFGQFGIGGGRPQKSAETPKIYEQIECGLSYPLTERITLSTAISHSPYRELGQGKINRFSSGEATYDIGCIDLDDAPRKMKKDELISSLNSMTKAYLSDSSEFVSLPAVAVRGKEIFEFQTKTDVLRRIKYVLEGNRVSIFLAGSYEPRGIDQALKLFDSVKYFSIRENAEKRIATADLKPLPQTPALKTVQNDAAFNNLKGRVQSVRITAKDVPVLVGVGESRIRSDETYDSAGNLLRTFWFQDEGYPTSVRVYGFIDGARVSDSQLIGGDTGFGIGVVGRSEAEIPPSDSRYEYKYEYVYGTSNKIIEKREYFNNGVLNRIHKFTYKNDLMEEKRFDTDGKLISTKRFQLDKNGNQLKFEFWWYDQTDKEVETYEYKKFDRVGNWTERRTIKTIINRGLTRTRTSNEFRTITYYEKQ